jgi:hypothetical protein
MEGGRAEASGMGLGRVFLIDQEGDLAAGAVDAFNQDAFDVGGF